MEALSLARGYITEDGCVLLLSFLKDTEVVPENTPRKGRYFSIYFDTTDQSLQLTASLDLLKTRFVDVRRNAGVKTAKGGVKILPSDFSGYINFEGGNKR